MSKYPRVSCLVCSLNARIVFISSLYSSSQSSPRFIFEISLCSLCVLKVSSTARKEAKTFSISASVTLGSTTSTVMGMRKCIREGLHEGIAGIGGTSYDINIGTLCLDCLTCELRVCNAVDVYRSVAIIGILQKLHVGDFPILNDRFDLHNSPLRISNTSCIRPVLVERTWRTGCA